jgi:hypothetical protein
VITIRSIYYIDKTYWILEISEGKIKVGKKEISVLIELN